MGIENGDSETRRLIEQLLERLNAYLPPANGPARPPRGTKLLMTKDEVAAALGVCRRTVEHLISKGSLRAVHLGRMVKIRPDEVERLIKSGNRVVARARFNSVA